MACVFFGNLADILWVACVFFGNLVDILRVARVKSILKVASGRRFRAGGPEKPCPRTNLY